MALLEILQVVLIKE